jgi:hypothetical protein
MDGVHFARRPWNELPTSYGTGFAPRGCPAVSREPFCGEPGKQPADLVVRPDKAVLRVTAARLLTLFEDM